MPDNCSKRDGCRAARRTLALQAASRDSAALWETGAALWEAFFGNAPRGQARAL